MIEAVEKNFDELVLKSQDPVLVMFYREKGCSFCDSMKPIIEKYAEAHPEVKVVKYALAQQPDSVNVEYPVKRFPTFYAFKDGKVVGTQEGAMPMDQLHLTFTPDKIPAKPQVSQVPVAKATMAQLLTEEANLLDAIASIRGHYMEVKREINKRRKAVAEWDAKADSCCDSCADGGPCEGGGCGDH